MTREQTGIMLWSAGTVSDNGVVTQRRVRRMVRTMTVLRHNILPVAVALLAALAVLFVATVSMACEAPVDSDAAVMAMDADGGACEQKTKAVVCQKACLVFCQSLLQQADGSTSARAYASVRYPSAAAKRTDFTREAEDPPPRP